MGQRKRWMCQQDLACQSIGTNLMGPSVATDFSVDHRQARQRYTPDPVDINAYTLSPPVCATHTLPLQPSISSTCVHCTRQPPPRTGHHKAASPAFP